MKIYFSLWRDYTTVKILRCICVYFNLSLRIYKNRRKMENQYLEFLWKLFFSLKHEIFFFKEKLETTIWKEWDRNAGYMNRICDFTPVVTQQRPPFTTHTRCRLFFLVVFIPLGREEGFFRDDWERTKNFVYITFVVEFGISMFSQLFYFYKIGSHGDLWGLVYIFSGRNNFHIFGKTIFFLNKIKYKCFAQQYQKIHSYIAV